ALEHTTTLIIAAGQSARYGSPKALALFENKPLITRALETASAFTDQRVVVVTGGYASEITPYLNTTRAVFNNSFASGMASSLQKGISEIMSHLPETQFIAIMPVDQPWITKGHLSNLLEASVQSDLCVFTQSLEFTGPPAVLPARLFERTKSLQGDRGLKSVIESHELESIFHELAGRDIDTPEQLEQSQLLKE
ncbi:MAG: nucleotidyltransferase family protein, partial [Cytophagaceae bacterium]